MVEFAPRPEFGQVPVQLRADDDGLLVLGTNEPIVLHSPGVEWEIVADGVHETARAVIDPSGGPVRAGAALRHRRLDGPPGRTHEPARARRELLARLGAALTLPSLSRTWCCGRR